MYDLVMLDNYGANNISRDEAVYLISLHNDFSNERIRPRNRNDIFLYLYGFFGEQKNFQTNFSYIDSFSREKYIMDVLSCKEHPDNTFGINVPEEFFEIKNFSTDEYSSLVFLVLLMFINSNGVIDATLIPEVLKNPIFSKDNIISVLNQNSTSIDEFRSSSLKRQFLYSKPIIKIGDSFVSANVFLMTALFQNSNYWIMRNAYQNKHSQKFINAFGIYFEMYIEELLDFCLSKKQYLKIPTVNTGKRADWLINIDEYSFIVEQKSSLSILDIKQNQPDIEAMKKHILNNWGEAVKQLSETQLALQIEQPIKIILVYEDYYKAKCLEELFTLNSELENDYNYWLMTIDEFEMLFYTYKTNPKLFIEIIEEKIALEHSLSSTGREIEYLLHKKDIINNKYLQDRGIRELYNKLKNSFY